MGVLPVPAAKRASKATRRRREGGQARVPNGPDPSAPSDVAEADAAQAATDPAAPGQGSASSRRRPVAAKRPGAGRLPERGRRPSGTRRRSGSRAAPAEAPAARPGRRPGTWAPPATAVVFDGAPTQPSCPWHSHRRPAGGRSQPVGRPGAPGDDRAGAANRRSRRRAGGHRAGETTPRPDVPAGRRRGAEPSRVEAEPTAAVEEDEVGDDDDELDAAGRRRRRRGRRGRGRGKGPLDADEAEDAAAADAAEAPGDEGRGDDEPLTRRRRRRRRSGSGAEAEAAARRRRGDRRARPPAAAARDEVQGVTGSTRLEAKRQRRRDGREQRRTRPPILSESEFLARREAVDRVMVVRQRATAPRSPCSRTGSWSSTT